jgi:hypothetical protein
MGLEPMERKELPADNQNNNSNNNKRPYGLVTRSTTKGQSVYMDLSCDVNTIELPTDIAKEDIKFIPLKEYKPSQKSTVFFSDYKPNEILNEFEAIFEDIKLEHKIADNKWRLTFDIV